MTDEPEQDQSYNEAAIGKMAVVWAYMYQQLVMHGVPRKHAVRIVIAWIRTTLGK